MKKTEIIRELSLIPEHELDRIQAYIHSILPKPKTQPATRQSLKGIWKDRGFETIQDLDEEVTNVRTELGASILNRRL